MTLGESYQLIRIENGFHQVMIGNEVEAKGLDLFANYFMQMGNQYGGVEALRGLAKDNQ